MLKEAEIFLQKVVDVSYGMMVFFARYAILQKLRIPAFFVEH